MKEYIFSNNCDSIERVKFAPTIEDIEGTPMLFSSDVEFAKRNGGWLTQCVLDALLPAIKEHAYTEKFPHVVIDTKVVMLMEGQYPAIPGWHCDAVDRSSRYGQPDPQMIDTDCKHWFCTMSTDQMKGVSNTAFINKPAVVTYDPEHVWGSVNKNVEEQIALHGLQQQTTDDGIVYQFDQSSLHSATECHNSGWRWFFRASMYRRPALNKIRHQVQVYANPNVGW